MLRNAHFRVIVPLLTELDIAMDKEITEPQKMEELNRNSEEKIALENEDSNREERFEIRCRKCRVKLFADYLLTEHSRSAMPTIGSVGEKVCNCLFVDGENQSALAVMATMGDTSQMQGLLCCF